MDSEQRQLRPWHALFRDPPLGFALTPLPVLAGAIPDGLQGSLYRNGPARFGWGSQRVGHWFDGDGAVLRVQFREGQAQATYRYVETPFQQREAKEQRCRYGTYGQRGLGIKNPANTAVLPLADRLWALCEAGSPWALDPHTLATLGAVTGFPGPYGAHPKRDPQGGLIWNVGVSYGVSTRLHCYAHDGQGRVLKHRCFRLPYATLIHDWILAPPYLVLLIPPLTVNLWAVLTGAQSFSQACTWTPELGSQWWLVDLETLQLQGRIPGDPCFAWHFGRATWMGERLAVEGCFYPDFGSNQYLAEVVTGRIDRDPQGYFGRLELTLGQKPVGSPVRILPRTCDFPVVGRNATYLGVHRQGSRFLPDLFTGIGRWDGETWQETPWPEGIYPSEAISVDPWVLTVIYDARHGSSEVWILDGQDLNRDPLCRLGLPQGIPPSFHGQFQPWLPSEPG